MPLMMMEAEDLSLVLEDRSIGYGPHFRYELDRASSSSSSSSDLLSITI